MFLKFEIFPLKNILLKINVSAYNFITYYYWVVLKKKKKLCSSKNTTAHITESFKTAGYYPFNMLTEEVGQNEEEEERKRQCS